MNKDEEIQVVFASVVDKDIFLDLIKRAELKVFKKGTTHERAIRTEDFLNLVAGVDNG